MVSGKLITGKDLKTRKKAKFKRYWWLLVGPAAVFVIFVLLLYKPGRYNPPEVVYDKQVSPYLTHVLSPQLYNGAQREEPFDLIVIQKGINDIIIRSKWPKESNGIAFFAPVVFFVPDRIVLMGTVAIGGVKLIVTIVAKPTLDEKGLLNLQVAKVKVGAMNITLLARTIAKKMYAHELSVKNIDPKNIGTRIAASLLDSESFEPVFKIDDKKVRVKKITIEQEKLTIHFVPVFE